jgi:ABC-2 type transport system ATP-binding protein
MLELGSGFDNQYTGMENIYLQGAMLGHSREFIKQRFDEIAEFSELGKFLNVPVKNYSSGMRSRLGFAIATAAEPDILILDEVLAVGDDLFRKKCMKKIEEMMSASVTVLFVSHSIPQVKSICDKAMLIEGGRIVAKGPVASIADIYVSKGQT